MEEKTKKKEDRRISSIGMSPLKRRVPSHIEGFRNILIGYVEMVMQKGRDFHETAATGTWMRCHRSMNLVRADVLEVRRAAVLLGEEVCAGIELTGRAAGTLG